MRLLLSALLVLFAPDVSLAKPPELKTLFPAGACRGQTVEVTATGAFDPWPVRAWSSCAGVTVTAAEEKGKLKVCVAADAEPGPCTIRLYNDEGASALRPFVVGTLPEVGENEPNDDPAHAQAIDKTRSVVNGRLAKNGDVDVFALELAEGQTLVASLQAHRVLGSPMDGVLQVTTPEGFVLAHNDDDHEMDPQLVFQAPRAGRYHVRVFAFPATPDSSINFAGGEAFIYRLTLTTGGFVEYAFPLAVAREGRTSVELAGWNIGDCLRTLMLEPKCGVDEIRVEHAELANTVEVRVVDHAALAETEPNDSAHPQSLSLPVALSGRIDPAGDRDAYRFEAKKGQPVTFRVESRALGAPLDPVLLVSDAKGKTLSEVDDTGRNERDATLTFKPPEDGAYLLTIRDLHGRGGFRFVYLVEASAPAPEVRLSVGDDRHTLAQGKPLKLKVGVERANGFAHAVEVALEGLPESVDAKPVVSEPNGPSAKEVTLEILAHEAPYSCMFRIVGKTREDSPSTIFAQCKIAGSKETTADAWLTVTAAKEEKK